MFNDPAQGTEALIVAILCAFNGITHLSTSPPIPADAQSQNAAADHWRWCFLPALNSQTILKMINLQ